MNKWLKCLSAGLALALLTPGYVEASRADCEASLYAQENGDDRVTLALHPSDAPPEFANAAIIKRFDGDDIIWRTTGTWWCFLGSGGCRVQLNEELNAHYVVYLDAYDEHGNEKSYFIVPGLYHDFRLEGAHIEFDYQHAGHGLILSSIFEYAGCAPVG